jgi:uncharacterized protein YigE (DUF2233 family)
VFNRLKKYTIALFFLMLGASSEASENRFTVITVDTRRERLDVFLNDDKGKPFKRFNRLSSWLKMRNKKLKFAMNAGMYDRDFTPVGLLVVDGKQLSPLNQSNASGNFFLKPNGVFLISTSGPEVIESSEYPAKAGNVRIATQSGPLLLRHGLIHPAFNAQSTSQLIRNGVGVSGSKVYFVISDKPVNFHEFSVFFRDELKCQDALYLDGVVSSLYSSALNRNDHNANLGPILGIID